MKITKRDGRKVPFEIEKIKTAISKAFIENKQDIDSDMLNIIALRAVAKAQKKSPELTVEKIQDAVESSLMECGFDDIAKSYILYRKNRENVRNTLIDVNKVAGEYIKLEDWRVKENSTVTYSVGGFILSNSGAITANYWLNNFYDKEVADAHRNCDIHLHDLSFFGPYCAGWSLKQLILEGLGGVPNKISSKPAKHLHTLCNQMVNFLGITQNEWAGAQAFSSFDTYLSAFVKKDNMSYKDVKQCIQSFIFGVNTPSRWGCVDTNTEVLSVNGFKKYNELKPGDVIYTWRNGINKNTVNAVVVKPFKGKMHSYKAEGYHQFVTPEHRMLVKNDGGDYHIERSYTVFDNVEKYSVMYVSALSANSETNKIGGFKVDEISGRDITVSEVDYDGIVWCPNVDDGTAIFRKDGCIYISGQSQAPFTNITLDWVVPEDLKDMPAIVGGESQDFTYGDCQKEMDMVNKAFIEVMLEGDANGRGHQYPIPTYSITKDFDWSDTENNRLLFGMAAKYGTPYFSNYVNSDMKPSDIRSMAILPDQEVIYQNVIDGSEKILKSRIQDLVRGWKENPDDYKLKMLMNGKFVDVTEMFEIPYDMYDTYVELELSNGYKQDFSYDHKCIVMRDDKIIDVLAQDVKAGDITLMAKYPFNEGSVTDTASYDLGFVAGLFYTHGYRINQKPMIRINVNPELVDTVTRVFKKYEITKKRINNFWLLTISGPNGEDPYDEISDYIGTFDDGFSIYEINHVKDGVLNKNSIFRREFLRGATYFSIHKAQLSFTMSDEKDMMSLRNVIAIAASVGQNFDYHIEEDTIVLDNLKLTSRLPHTDEYYGIPITKVSQVESNYDYVYNFTVDTPEHLYTLPNGMITHQCCRLRLDLTELRRKNGGFFGSGESTGSVGVVTINLPKLAYESENKEEFYNKLDHVMDIAARSLDTKRKVVTKLLNDGFFPYTKRYLGRFDNHFSTIGLVGMNEAGLNARWIKAGMDDKRTQIWAEELLNHMRDRLIIYQQQYGALFNLESTPAESTAYRFAKHDKERYPDIKTANDNGTPYYTNSTNLPVGYTQDVFEALDIQDNLQILYTSGTVFHAFLGEKLPSWESAAKLVKTICDNYRLPYITLSPTYSICKNHGYITGEVYKCPECGEETEVCSRITGYYRPIKNWNDGKAQEFKDRKEYKYDASKEDLWKDELRFTDLDLGFPHLNDEVNKPEGKSQDKPLLLTTKMCPNCNVVKSYIDSHNLDVNILDASEGKGAEISSEYSIVTAPTLITRDGDVVCSVSDIMKILRAC